MQSFIDNQFASLFNDANWKSNWSSASDTPIESRINSGTTIATSVSANEAGIREVTQAAVMVSDLGVQSLGQDARKAVVNLATTLMNDGLAKIAQVQGRIGAAQNRTDASTSYLTTQTTYLQGRIDDLEGRPCRRVPSTDDAVDAIAERLFADIAHKPTQPSEIHLRKPACFDLNM